MDRRATFPRVICVEKKEKKKKEKRYTILGAFDITCKISKEVQKQENSIKNKHKIYVYGTPTSFTCFSFSLTITIQLYLLTAQVISADSRGNISNI